MGGASCTLSSVSPQPFLEEVATHVCGDPGLHESFTHHLPSRKKVSLQPSSSAKLQLLRLNTDSPLSHK